MYKFELRLIDYCCQKCGNTKCNKTYLQSKYGLSLKSTIKMKKDGLWHNRKQINKWYICGGCKLVKYCSRKCQKISWNKQNHAYQCKIICHIKTTK